MINIREFKKELAAELLDFLYQDELFNLHLIHRFQNHPSEIGDVYLDFHEDKLSGVLHIQFDGNSNFTSFYACHEQGLYQIAKQISEKRYEKQLIAGKTAEVEYILSELGIEKPVDASNYYMLDHQHYLKAYVKPKPSQCLRKVCEGADLTKVKEYLIDFFGAETEDEVANITSHKKLDDMVQDGLYLLYEKNLIVGMARFSGYSDRFTEITTLYIEPKHRSKGYGKSITVLMIEEALKSGRIPVLQAHEENESAIRTYEGIGFHKEADYSFEFI